jgi:hypothetical protein
MKKLNFTLFSILLLIGISTTSRAQTMQQNSLKKISFPQYLMNSINRILTMENLYQCLGRSAELRFITSDCNAFLNDVEFETSKIHTNAKETFQHIKKNSTRDRYAPFLDLYTNMVTAIHQLNHEHQNDLDKQEVAFAIQQQVRKTKKEFIKLTNVRL